MTDLRRNLARNIKDARKVKGWTQTELAVEAGISFRGLQDIETAKHFPRQETLSAIAGALGVTEESLYSGSVKTSFIQGENKNIGEANSEILSEVRKLREEINASPFRPEKAVDPKKAELLALVDRLSPAMINNLIEIVGDLLGKAPSKQNKIRPGRPK